MKLQVSILAFVLCWSTVCHADEIYLTLKRTGARIAANSVININRIGTERSSYSYYYYGRYTNDGPLVCHTTDPTCCRAEDDLTDNEETGDWFFPNGDVVGNSSSSSNFYVARDHRELALHSRYSYSNPTGVYCCDIATVNATVNFTEGERELMGKNSSSAICVGLYSSYQLSRCNDLSLSNGYVTYDSPYIPGRVAQFTCYPGYSLVGSATRECSQYGWNGSMPSCQVDCGPPSPVQNGQVDTPQGTTAGNRAVYSCNDGYTLQGNGVRYCNRYSRTWSTRTDYSYRYYPQEPAPICVDTALVQIKFSPSEHCASWDNSRSSRIEQQLENKIISIINSDDLNVTTANLRDGFFSCRSSQAETSFRTTLLGTKTVSATELVDSLQSWVNDSPSFQLEWYVVDIDSRCPVSVSSRYEPECGGSSL